MSRRFLVSKVAAIQMASGPNVKANLAEAEKLIKIAVQQEAELVVLPENFAIMGTAEDDKVKIAEEPGPAAEFSQVTGCETRHMAGRWYHPASIRRFRQGVCCQPADQCRG